MKTEHGAASHQTEEQPKAKRSEERLRDKPQQATKIAPIHELNSARQREAVKACSLQLRACDSRTSTADAETERGLTRMRIKTCAQ
jgi:hypothetical protein